MELLMLVAEKGNRLANSWRNKIKNTTKFVTMVQGPEEVQRQTDKQTDLLNSGC
jgi:hypothetical protein